MDMPDAATERLTDMPNENSAPGTGLVILNPVAGAGNPDKVKEILFTAIGAERFDLYETTGEESLREVVQTALEKNKYAWVAAAGGDGTVSQVADGLIGYDVPLGIIPAGTSNALAKELGIPEDLEAAARLLSEKSATRHIDAIRVGKQYFVLRMGIGLESVTLQKTSSAEKNRWGPAAYLWTAVKEAFGWQPYRFTLTVDGRTHHLRVSELIIANARRIGVLGLEWPDVVEPDDGRVDIAIARAPSLVDYARVIWALLRKQQPPSAYAQFLTARERVELNTRHSLPIHGDGEALDVDMPLTAVVVPGVLPVIIPVNH